MPELPEVETVRTSLEQLVIGRTISEVEVELAKLIKIPTQQEEEFRKEMIGQRIEQVARRGKYLLLKLSGGKELIIHLRMTGKLLYLPTEQEWEKHTHITFHLDNGFDLRFNDIRQFGALYLVDQEQKRKINGLETLGVEPVCDDFTLEKFNEILEGKKQKAKVFLLDQRFVAGIGNIYADEILFQSRIHPNRLVNQLDSEEIERLWFAIKDRLSEAILYKGSSIKDYVDGFGNKGEFQLRHKAYGKHGQPCVECGVVLEKTKVGGRSTSYCPSCQQ